MIPVTIHLITSGEHFFKDISGDSLGGHCLPCGESHSMDSGAWEMGDDTAAWTTRCEEYREMSPKQSPSYFRILNI